MNDPASTTRPAWSASFRLVKPLGGNADIVLGQGHVGSASQVNGRVCENMINMLNCSGQTERDFAAVQTRPALPEMI
jgi:hypothetical protein